MKKNKILNIILNILLSIALVISIAIIIFKVNFIRVVVNGNSMNPSLIDGSIGYMKKISKNTKINRFDIVVSHNENTVIIKRILGLPNETVDLVSNQLYVDGQIVEQTFPFIPKTTEFSQTHWVLGPDTYLLVGDNRMETIEPVCKNRKFIMAKDGFSYAKYDVDPEKCDGVSDDYSGCPIKEIDFYKFK